MNHITLNLLDQHLAFQVEEAYMKTSPHTGCDLRYLTVAIQVTGKSFNDRLAEALGNAQTSGEPLEGVDGAHWKVANRSYSYTDGSDRFHHTVELREVEQLHATRLEFNGLALIPERYKEEVDDTTLVITAILPASDEETAKINAMVTEALEADGPLYFDVVRAGVSDTPLRMRLGRCLYESNVSEGTRRHLIRLVAEEGDVESGPGLSLLYQPQLARMMERTIAHHKAISVLINELQGAGALDAEAVRRVLTALSSDAVQKTEGRVFDAVKSGLDVFF